MAGSDWAKMAAMLAQAGMAAYGAKKAADEQKKYAQAVSGPQKSFMSKTPYMANQGLNAALQLIMGQAGDLYASRSKKYGRDINAEAMAQIAALMNPGGGSFGGGGASASWGNGGMQNAGWNAPGYATLPKVVRGLI